MGLLEQTLTSENILAEHSKVHSKVHSFLQTHLLHWLEAMSLLQKIPEAITALQKLEAAVKASRALTVLRGCY
jgi:hypothetical protein